MAGGYLDEQIFDSTINLEHDLHVRWVLVAFIILSDKHGVLNLTHPALARKANVTPKQLDDALTILAAPDPHATKGDTTLGRRIELVAPEERPWGWRVINKDQYLAKANRNAQRDAARDRKRDQRQRESELLFQFVGDPQLAEGASHASQSKSVTHRDEGVTQRDMSQPASVMNIYTHPDSSSKPEPDNKSARVSEVVRELADAAHLWNDRAKAWGVRATTGPVVASCTEAYRRVRPKLRDVCGDDFSLVELVRRIESNTWLHRKRFMTFRWLFASKGGELNAEKIWQGRYVEDGGSEGSDGSRGKRKDDNGPVRSSKRNPFA